MAKSLTPWLILGAVGVAVALYFSGKQKGKAQIDAGNIGLVSLTPEQTMLQSTGNVGLDKKLVNKTSKVQIVDTRWDGINTLFETLLNRNNSGNNDKGLTTPPPKTLTPEELATGKSSAYGTYNPYTNYKPPTTEKPTALKTIKLTANVLSNPAKAVLASIKPLKNLFSR